MDRARGFYTDQLCALIWRSQMGFYSESVRFEGGGRRLIGLNRTGKSCRLRWVNYLHPGLKRGKMTPNEEKLVVELHDKWGNRWSRIARKLPGRTDNEIKNYWRTYSRKKAQEEKKRLTSQTTQMRKRAKSPSLSSSPSSSNVTTVNSTTFPETGEARFYDSGGPVMVASGDETKINEVAHGGENEYSMDDIWKDIENTIEPVSDGFSEEGCNIPCPSMVSPPWDYGPDMPWRMDEEESKLFIPYELGSMFFTG